MSPPQELLPQTFTEQQGENLGKFQKMKPANAASCTTIGRWLKL